VSRYTSNLVRFDVSDTWIDQSIVAFRIPPQSGRGDASFVVTHDATLGEQSFDKYFAGQQAQCRKSLPKFELIRAELLQSNGAPMGWLEFTWDNNGKQVQIRQIQFDRAPIAVICTLTGAPRDIPKLDAQWQALMASIAFNEPESPKFSPDVRTL